MIRYVHILTLIVVSTGFASGNSYSYKKMPLPQINYLKTPYEQIRDVNTVAHFDGSSSYDPEGGRIIEWKWDFYKFNGKDWDLLFTLGGPDKAIFNCKFPEMGWFRVRLSVRASDGISPSRWNQDSDVKDCFIYVIFHKLYANEYVGFGSGMTFTYLIKLPKDIQVKEACVTIVDEYALPLAEIWVKNPVIGKEGKIEWDGKANKGPNAGEFIPAGRFSINFRVVPFHSILKKSDDNKTDEISEIQESQVDPNNNQD